MNVLDQLHVDEFKQRRSLCLNDGWKTQMEPIDGLDGYGRVVSAQLTESEWIENI